jgi:hypothetical protein
MVGYFRCGLRSQQIGSAGHEASQPCANLHSTAVVRKITRDLNEDVRDHVRGLANTEAFQ